jgi:hypothetical protein
MLVAVVVAAFLAGQSGEGEGEGEDPCAPVCVDATHLSFCDTGVPTTLDCVTVVDGARCGELSSAWGVDCLLPSGAACDAGYGFGDSRCDDALACIDGVCAPGTPSTPEPLSPTAGTSLTSDSSSSTSSSCFDGSAAAALSLPIAGALRLRRRRRP